MKELIQRWREEADRYQQQSEVAQAAGVSHELLLNQSITLRSCANELEIALKKAIIDWAFR